MAAIDSPNNTARSVHISQPLSDFSIGYHPTGFIADQVAPVVPVKKRNDLYYKWDKLSAFRVDRTDGLSTLRADGALVDEERFGFTTDGYVAEEWSKRAIITDEMRDNADDVLKLEQAYVRRLQDRIFQDYELRVASAATTASLYPAANTVTLATTAQWNNASFASLNTTGTGHSAIKQNILAGIDAVRKATGGLVPNRMVLPFSVALVVMNDPGLDDLRKYVQQIDGNGDLNLAPPSWLGMKVLIPRSSYVSTVEGVNTAATTDIWGKNVVLFYSEPNPTTDSLTFMSTFRSRPFQVKVYRIEERDATVYQPSVVQTEKAVTYDCAYLIASAIA